MANLLTWWNLMFLIPGATGIFLGLLSVLGIDGDADHDADVDVDVDVDVDADVDADADADADGDADSDSDSDSDNDHDSGNHGPGMFLKGLSLLGIGHIPVTLVLTMLMLAFAIIGFSANQMMAAALPPAVFAPISAIAAGVLALVITGFTSRAAGRLIPKQETYASSFVSLSGCRGRVVLVKDASSGFAQIRDRYGNMREVHVQAANGVTLERGLPVQVVKADTKHRICLVAVDEVEVESADDTSRAKKQRETQKGLM